MSTVYKFALFLFFALAGAASCVPVKLAERPIPEPAVSVIPQPWRVEVLPGSFTLVPGTTLVLPEGSAAEEAAMDFKARLAAAFGLDLPVVRADRPAASPALFFKSGADPELDPEGYRLVVRPDGITLEAGTDRGFLYGTQTILQLCPPSVYGREGAAAGPLTIRCVSITDRPRFAWRGLLLDVSRHFFPKEFILRLIDELAIHKMNTFHWHLTDDQGWRVEIKRYPRLTEVGAWRVDREDKPWNAREPQRPGERATYGGFYTQDEIREIVAYAGRRGVTIIPEIEMPGHCLSALASYPELSCSGGPFTVPAGGVWPIKDVYCAGNDAVFEFLQNVLDEALDLFPGRVIHIGGDEVDKTTWKACPKCQARMAAEELKNEEELQSYFIKRIEKYLNAKGRTLIGWDEILEGGLAPNAMVMSWRGTQGGIAAAQSGHDVAMTPTSHCYFDYYQGEAAFEPLAIGGFLPLGKVYSFEPVPAELSSEQAPRILGAQANLWTEYVADASHARYMLYPRLAAMAEVGWSGPDRKNWDDFRSRLATQLRRYEAAGMNYARSLFAVRLKPKLDEARRECLVSFETESFRPEIRYTLDGTPPSPRSPLYRNPLRLKKSAVVKAATFARGKILGPVIETRFTAHQALGRTVVLKNPYAGRYSGGGPFGLVDGLRGSASPGDGRWQGFEGADFEAVIDLGKVRKVKRVGLAFLQNTSSWIFLPEKVEVAVSNDGRAFETAAGMTNDPLSGPAPVEIKTWTADVKARTRYIRVWAKTVGVCPAWHPGAGGKAWVFIDEVGVE
jgi:hexosaminidase